MLKFFEFSSENSWILTELRSEKFERFGPSPIEPFNPGEDRAEALGRDLVVPEHRAEAGEALAVARDVHARARGEGA